MNGLGAFRCGLAEAPERLAELVMACVEIDPDHRPADMALVADRLDLIHAQLVAEQQAQHGVPVFDDDDEEIEEPPTFPEMLKMVFEAKLASPEFVLVQPKWIAGGIYETADDFHKYTRNHDLLKNEGIILRHLLRLVILAGEFHQTQQVS